MGQPDGENLSLSRLDETDQFLNVIKIIVISDDALSVIDAYVDASLSDFDISKDLTLRVSPTMINNSNDRNPIRSNALGLQCSLNF